MAAAGVSMPLRAWHHHARPIQVCAARLRGAGTPCEYGRQGRGGDDCPTESVDAHHDCPLIVSRTRRGPLNDGQSPRAQAVAMRAAHPEASTGVETTRPKLGSQASDAGEEARAR